MTVNSSAHEVAGPVYADFAATTPVDPAVAEEVLAYFSDEFGNAGSRTHEWGARAKRRVNLARQQVADVVGVRASDVVFTSGATESNNLALFGLARSEAGESRRHIVTTAIEHHAVLEPLTALRAEGFEVEFVGPSASGHVSAEDVIGRIRDDTLLVSVMHVNNETGAIQPVLAIGDALSDHPAYFHVDAAQSFGKLAGLTAVDADLISISGHKIAAPKGIGALVVKSRRGKRPPLQPLMVGGGQEKGLRPGTLPVALIAGIGTASSLAADRREAYWSGAAQFKASVADALSRCGASLTSDSPDANLPSILSVLVPGVDAEALVIACRDLVGISVGSACSSEKVGVSHVLQAMGLTDQDAASVVRLSWMLGAEEADWRAWAERITAIRPAGSQP